MPRVGQPHSFCCLTWPCIQPVKRSQYIFSTRHIHDCCGLHPLHSRVAFFLALLRSLFFPFPFRCTAASTTVPIARTARQQPYSHRRTMQISSHGRQVHHLGTIGRKSRIARTLIGMQRRHWCHNVCLFRGTSINFNANKMRSSTRVINHAKTSLVKGFPHCNDHRLSFGFCRRGWQPDGPTWVLMCFGKFLGTQIAAAAAAAARTHSFNVASVHSQHKDFWIPVLFTQFSKMFFVLIFLTYAFVGCDAVQRWLHCCGSFGHVHEFRFIGRPRQPSKRSTRVNVSVKGRAVDNKGTAVGVVNFNGSVLVLVGCDHGTPTFGTGNSSHFMTGRDFRGKRSGLVLLLVVR